MQSAYQDLRCLDSVKVTVLVDNETDMLSPPCACCDPHVQPPDQVLAAHHQSESTRMLHQVEEGAAPCMDFSHTCLAGHGLSLLLEAEVDGVQRSLLFDAGPSGLLWRINAHNLGVRCGDIEAVVLSHWHVDHSGGLPEVARMIQQARSASCPAPTPGKQQGLQQQQQAAEHSRPANRPAIFDLHPGRPWCRGLQLRHDHVIPFNQDPPIAKLESLGATVQLHQEPHILLDGCFLVSGHIPRRTSYEAGNPRHASQWEEGGAWQPDPEVADERYLLANIKGRGPVLFSACSHAGIVNCMRDVQMCCGRAPFCVFGGLHLSPRECQDRLRPTIKDMVAMSPVLVVAAHCTGWRAKAALEAALPGRCMPCSVGTQFRFNSAT